MAEVEEQEPESTVEREKQKKYLSRPFIWLLVVLILGLLIFALLQEQNPVQTQSEGQRSGTARKAESKPTPAELVPLHSGSPGGNNSLGGGTSLGGAHH